MNADEPTGAEVDDPAALGDDGLPHDQPYNFGKPSKRPGIDRFEEAAIKAEFETGRREETVQEAKRHVLVRFGIIILGSLICLAGVAMLLLPGPGFITIAIGLALLAQEVPFAKNLLDKVEERIPEDENGDIPKWTIALGVISVVGAIGGSIYWFFFR